MNNIYILNKNYKKIGTLSNQGANPQAPYYEDLFVQELETGADTYQFSTMSTPYTQDLLEIGNHIMFTYKNRNELFTITSLEYSHNEGYKTIGVYAEGIGFDLLEVYMKRPENEKEDSSSGSGGSSSGGNNGSEGGRDEDGDGDTSTDDEYADLDDMYLDENGIIVYDKDGSGPPKEEDMYVDENGIIVYRRNKRNRKKDSLEFKNISYSRFLSILLKNTGWSYVCQPGLESVKHDITVRYDTNIFALLQDSMQSYRGVELEFVHELVGGRVQKVIKAYKDGGRGSFVGKRFEYGKNVRGITKTQEVTDSEDDTILYVDNVGINVQYDVDFALKSAEIPEIEIGDTHYVIDNDFCPPMQIKARIGKIEISFSDPTVNKIYLANNKRISGSAVENEFGSDDVADMLDDYEYGDNGAAYDHYHDRLICDNEKTYVSEDGKTQGTTRWQTSVELSEDKLLPAEADSYYLGDEYTPWRDIFTKYVTCNDKVITPSIRAYDYDVNFDRVDMQNVEEITNKQELLDFIVNNINIYEYSAIEIDDIMNAPENHGYQIYYGILAEDFVNHGDKCTVTDPVARRIMRGLVQTDTDNDGSMESEDGHNRHTYNIPALLTALIGAFQHYVNGNSPNAPSDPDDPGTGTITSTFDKARGNELYVYDLYADRMSVYYDLYAKEIVTDVISSVNLIKADVIDAISIEAVKVEISDRLYVNDIAGTSISHMTAAEIDAIKTGIIDIGVKAKVKEIEFPDSSTLTTANGLGNLDGLIDAVEVDNDYTDTGKDIDLHVRKPTYFDGPIYMTGEWNSWGGASNHFTSIYGVGQLETMIINCDCWRPNDIYKDVTFYGDVIVDGTLTYKDIKPSSDISKKENIRYINNQAVQKENLETRNYSNEDLLGKADLHDFIVNQVNICEYNFIGDTANKIGFIANDYEGTKVGDKIVSKQEFKERNDDVEIIEISESLVYDVDNLLFATIGALQEEVRTKNEKIASLEDRLARIEAMLGINNNDN